MFSNDLGWIESTLDRLLFYQLVLLNRLEKGQNVEENRNNLIKAAQKFLNEIVISVER